MQTYSLRDAKDLFIEPCDCCTFFVDETGECRRKHRIKRIGLSEGKSPEMFVRRQGGCSDYEMHKDCFADGGGRRAIARWLAV